jgi:nucleotide-binding universal stress UspA family protein
MFKKILIPLDGSELAECSLKVVKTMAEPKDCELVLLRVAAHQFSTFYLDDPEIVRGLLEADRTECLSYLQSVSSDLQKLGYAAKTIVRDGLAPQIILETAEAEGADLIAMSTHGRTGMSRWLIGSVADKVVHGSKAPVLLVRPEMVERNA